MVVFKIKIKISFKEAILDPLISIIMPAYNSARFISKSIQSVLSQSFTNFELIIINDGSTDETDAIVSRYIDPRINYVIKEKNTGLIESLNLGLTLAKGNYIARLDSDDLMVSNRLELQSKVLNDNADIHFVTSNVEIISEDGNSLTFTNWSFNSNEYKFNLMLRQCICHSSVMFRRSIIGVIGVYDLKWLHAEDYDYWLRISKNFNFYQIPVVLTKWREVSTGISNSNNSFQENQALAISKEGIKKQFNYDIEINFLKFLKNPNIKDRYFLTEVDLTFFKHLREYSLQNNLREYFDFELLKFIFFSSNPGKFREIMKIPLKTIFYFLIYLYCYKINLFGFFFKKNHFI